MSSPCGTFIRRPLEPGRARQLFIFAWRAPGSQGPLEMKAELSRPGTAPIPLPLAGDSRVATDADGASRAVASVVPPPGAAPGDYTLRVRYMRYWRVVAGAVCLAPVGDGSATRLRTLRPGRFELVSDERPGEVLGNVVDADGVCPAR